MHFRCVHCQQMLDIEQEIAGKNITCPSCKKEMVVPFDKDIPLKIEPKEIKTMPQEKIELDMEPLNTGMEPKGYFATAFQFGLITGTGFGLLNWSMPSGIAFGVVFGGIMGILFREETYTLSFDDKSDFIADTNVAITQIGYKAKEATENMMRYKPGFQAGILAGDIIVIFKAKKASFIGPQIYIKKVVKKIAGAEISK